MQGLNPHICVRQAAGSAWGYLNVRINKVEDCQSEHSGAVGNGKVVQFATRTSSHAVSVASNLYVGRFVAHQCDARAGVAPAPRRTPARPAPQHGQSRSCLCSGKAVSAPSAAAGRSVPSSSRSAQSASSAGPATAGRTLPKVSPSGVLPGAHSSLPARRSFHHTFAVPARAQLPLQLLRHSGLHMTHSPLHTHHLCAQPCRHGERSRQDLRAGDALSAWRRLRSQLGHGTHPRLS